jgi:hypothetical protein
MFVKKFASPAGELSLAAPVIHCASLRLLNKQLEANLPMKNL